MKNLRLFVGFFLTISILTLCFTACNKQEISETETMVEAQTSNTSEYIPAPSNPEILNYVDIDLNVKNGRLVFEDTKQLLDVIEEIYGNPERKYTRQALDEWEQRLGFKSMRFIYNEIMDEFKNLESEDEYNSFKQFYQDKLTFNDDRVPLPLVTGGYAHILDEDGIFYEKEILHHITSDKKQILILDGNENKLESVKISLETNEEEQVFVFNMLQDVEEASVRMPCGSQTWRGCSRQVGNKRISSYFYLSSIISGGSYPNWTRRAVYKAELVSERRRKAWWGWTLNNDDMITFGTGWGIIGSGHNTFPPTSTSFCASAGEMCGGFSWSVTGGFIGFSHQLSGIEHTTTSSCNLFLVNYLYNINFFTNTAVAGLTCSDDCFDRVCN